MPKQRSESTEYAKAKRAYDDAAPSLLQRAKRMFEGMSGVTSTEWGEKQQAARKKMQETGHTKRSLISRGKK